MRRMTLAVLGFLALAGCCCGHAPSCAPPCAAPCPPRAGSENCLLTRWHEGGLGCDWNRGGTFAVPPGPDGGAVMLGVGTGQGR
jgi:hypothetical protein